MESDEDRCVDLTRGRKKPNTSGLSARDVNDLEAQKAALTAAQLEEHNQLLATTKKVSAFCVLKPFIETDTQ